ncbi:GNAT family N-acetyltransferase [Flavobacterium sp.]|uniref:GNAT family N-acetyltransferase n=1 Tax=Flavobacterium sp. TaxID=239 RepID=UPI002623C43A|nr:GNAT family N-acetyltransferase [Flavobacterium sp.]MDD2984922.1 GNAT family N-acetyltransferase [Flavobacterium sp.]
MTEIKRLDWDSDFFGIEVGELFTNSTNFVVNSDFDLIYVKSDIKTDVEITSFEKSFTENKVVYQKDLVLVNDSNSAIKEISEIEYSIEELYELAFESGKHSRFKLDYKIEKHKFFELYELWVVNSLNKKFADEVLIYKEDSKIIGFVSYKITDTFATIGLIAVNLNHQGKGIGKGLIHQVENKLIQKNIFELRIPTQESNVQACFFYEKLGYEKFQITIINHFWKR